MVYLMGMAIDAIYVILALEFIGAISFILFWYWYNKGKFQALICEKYLETYKIKKKMKVKMSATEFTWNRFTYIIDFKCAIIDEKGKPIIYYTYEIAQPIKTLIGISTTVDSQTFKILSDGKIMQHLGDRKITKTYMYIIVACVVMLGVLGVVSVYMISKNNADVIALTKEYLNATATFYKNNPIIVR